MKPDNLDGVVKLPTGTVSLKAIDAIFATMPYELDFIDAYDNYQWYSPNPWRDNNRLDKRLGDTVLNCHPERVVPMVQQVLELLHSGKRDVVESPQIMDGQRVLIRYYAVRDRHDKKKYLGTLQVTENVEKICKLNDQKAFQQGIVEGRIITPPVSGIIDGSTGASQTDASTGASKH